MAIVDEYQEGKPADCPDANSSWCPPENPVTYDPLQAELDALADSPVGRAASAAAAKLAADAAAHRAEARVGLLSAKTDFARLANHILAGDSAKMPSRSLDPFDPFEPFPDPTSVLLAGSCRDEKQAEHLDGEASKLETLALEHRKNAAKYRNHAKALRSAAEKIES